MAIFVVLSLVGASGPATAGAFSECSMAATASGTAMDHEQMGCCTPECAVTCPSAVLGAGEIGVAETLADTLPQSDAVPDALHAFEPGMIDPPPRLFS